MHRNYAHASRIAPRLLCVFPSRNEEDVRTGPFCTDRLLFQAPDRDHGPILENLAARDHLVAAVDVVAELLDDVEGERETRRRPTHPAEIDVHGHGQRDLRFVLEEDPDERALRALAV